MTGTKLINDEKKRYRIEFTCKINLTECNDDTIKDIIKKLNSMGYYFAEELADIIGGK